MDPSRWYVLAVLVTTLVLLVTEKLPIDVVSLGAIVALVLGRILGIEEAVAGFANPAFLTIAFLFVVAEGLIRTGAVGWLSRPLSWATGANTKRLLLVTLLAVATVSAFINNTPVVVLFVPVVLGLAERSRIPPSKLLMPICFAASLGGTCTLIGTSTNLAVNAWIQKYGAENGLSPFGMFDFTAFGVIYAAIGLAYLFLVAPRLLPDRRPLSLSVSGGRLKEYLTEIRVSVGSRFAGSPVEGILKDRMGMRVLQLIRGEEIRWPPFTYERLAEGDILLVKGEVSGVLELHQAPGIDVHPGGAPGALEARSRELTLAELVVVPNSRLVGRTLEEYGFRRETGCHALAIQRHGSHLREKVSELLLGVGDVLLVQGDLEAIRSLRGSKDYLLLEGIAEQAVNRRKAPLALVVFLGIVTFASLQLHPSLDILVLSMAGACLLVGSRTLTLRQAYRAVDWSVLFVIAGMMAIAAGLRRTGIEGMLASWLVDWLAPLGPWPVLVGVTLSTCLLGELLSNSATGILMIPLALQIASKLDANPAAFAIAVIFGASASFATPFGYQTNAIIYGPGGYRFRDYLRVGIPLDLLLVTVASLLIPVFWPL